MVNGQPALFTTPDCTILRRKNRSAGYQTLELPPEWPGQLELDRPAKGHVVRAVLSSTGDHLGWPSGIP